ncbi:MAG TPA: conjugative transposon protein TraM [Puia sp.]|jgi:conjugative transposon TraM protein|nr:conjugative transposon protein TraM [Puia sp.]
METRKHSQKFLRQRKLLTVVPLLTLPFLVIFFITLGGGKGKTISTNGIPQAGFNTVLPDAHFKKEKEKDKLGIYEETAKDSAKLVQQIKNDPYYKLEIENADTIKNSTSPLQNILQHNADKYHEPGFSKLQTSTSNVSADSNEQRVVQKLEQLKIALKKADAHSSAINQDYPDNSSSHSEATRLQNMMDAINPKNNEADPEVNQLSGMLDKIMLIQHPESLQDSMRKLSEKNKAQTFVVHTGLSENNITVMDTPSGLSANGFYGLNDEKINDNSKQNSMEAVIPESQTLVSGATVKLQLLNDIFVGGIKIAKNEFVYGSGSLSNERLKIVINSLRSQQNILPVSLTVYDMDGMEGIYIPGSINRDVSKQSADDAISTIGMTTVDQSVGTQAAVAGLQAAKSLADKKIKLIRVTVKSGYRVLLKDLNQK